MEIDAATMAYLQLAVTHALSTAGRPEAGDAATGSSGQPADAFEITQCVEVMRKQGAGYWKVTTRGGHQLFAREGEGETTGERDFKALVQSEVEAAGCRQVRATVALAARRPANPTDVQRRAADCARHSRTCTMCVA